MRKLFKTGAILLLSLFVTVGLIGCGKKEEASNEPVKNEKISKVNDKEAESNDSADEGSEQSTDKEADPVKPTATEDEAKATTDTPSASKGSGNTTPSSTPAVEPKPAAPAPTTKPAPPPPTPAAPVVTTPPNTTPAVPAETKVPAATVTISIKGPKDRGTILAPTKVESKEGDTIYDILLQTTKKHGIQMETRGSGASAYVEGIDNIYEFDYGVKSGWVFELNGVSLTKSIGTMKVNDGDSIECYYTE
ncbi:DUF4430 domain-containing protein [Neobacillus niacini]|uniref:DUF4430 domain-containing protein n=1 Tax=Neobacillus niacini TaxID=86668 RepID=UPI0030013B45